jgi:hypothetical protein
MWAGNPTVVALSWQAMQTQPFLMVCALFKHCSRIAPSSEEHCVLCVMRRNRGCTSVRARHMCVTGLRLVICFVGSHAPRDPYQLISIVQNSSVEVWKNVETELTLGSVRGEELH